MECYSLKVLEAGSPRPAAGGPALCPASFSPRLSTPSALSTSVSERPLSLRTPVMWDLRPLSDLT